MILKFTFRNLIKRPFLNLIKIVGLSLALSGILIIVMFLKNELTYESSHEKSDQIYRFTLTNNVFFGGKHFARLYNTSYIPEMVEHFPEIESYVRLAPIRGGFMKLDDKFIEINQAFTCDSTFIQVFNADLLTGNPENILNSPGSMILSESFAKKVFADRNPVGKILTLPGGQFNDKDMDYTIKGVMKDFPQNSHFHPDFITSPVHKSVFDGWAWTYLLLKENANPENIQSGFNGFYSSLIAEDASGMGINVHLQNISDIHLNSHKLREIEPNGNMTVVYTLSVATLILLFIALTNFANLNLGMASYSSRFLVVNHIFGSSNLINLKYFIYEGIIISLAAVLLSGFFTGIANNIIYSQFGLNLFTNNILLSFMVVVWFIILSLLFGVMPLFRQGLNNLKSLIRIKNNGSRKRRGISKSLIVVQYTISMLLIIAVIVIYRQTNYALNKGMGVDNDNLICLENVHTNVQQDFAVFKEELLKYESIESVSAMLEPPGGEANDMFMFAMEGYIPDETKNGDNLIGVFPCDYSFANIFNLKFLSGKNFSPENKDNEGLGEYIINEAAMKRLNYENPEDIVGKEFALFFHNDMIKIPTGKIIGVVKNFHLSSIKKEIEPLVMFKRDGMWLLNFVVSLKPETQQKAIADVETVWTTLFPEYPFEYNHISSLYRSVYKTELMQEKLLSIFTLIALFICSMGLLGLSLLVVQQRIKEIGIRKVNGAKINQIMIMLNWDLVKWILISIVISIPIAFFAMNKWLENFAYKIALSWWIFTSAGLVALVISLITISLVSWKAANSNPVESLRYE
ncbi:MAG TPA: hypothetical protein DCG75_19645 [Bacteroidales bacterium]|nr:hypothetical protein [Bacteroidales bacterium]